MTFTPKNYTIGDVLHAADLNEMDANDDHNREEANYYPILTASRYELGASSSFSLKIDGSTAISLSAGTTRTKADLSISGLSVGLHALVLADGAGTVLATWNFYKSADLSYLSVWVYMGSTSGENVNNWIKSITVIGHRSLKYWS